MFKLQAKDVSAMCSYAQAKHAFDTLPKWGEKERLLSRSKTLRIRQRGELYECTYNNNVCVTYKPDDTVELRTAGWPTPSTATFIQRCIGTHVYLHKSRLYVSLTSGYYVLDNLVVDLKSMKPVNPTQEQRKVVDPAKAKEIRKHYQSLFKEVRMLAAAIPHGPETANDYMHMVPPIYRGNDAAFSVARCLLVHGDQELARCWLLASALRPVEHTVFGRRRWNATTPEYRPTKERIGASINKLLRAMYKYEEAWMYEDVPLGELPKPDLL